MTELKQDNSLLIAFGFLLGLYIGASVTIGLHIAGFW